MALAVDTLLPTPWGWTSVYDLQAGDHLFDELGYPTLVTEVSDPYHDPNAHNFAVGWAHSRNTQGWGTYERLVCSGDTGLHTYRHHWLKHNPRADIDLDWPKKRELRRADNVALTMVGRVKRVKGVEYPTANHRIPITRSLQLQRRDLPLPPYVLGVLINYYNYETKQVRLTRRTWHHTNGVFETNGVTLTRPENLDITTSKDARVWSFLDEKSQEKWEQIVTNQKRLDYGPIPAEYLRGSEQQRMDLLSGLLDTHPISRDPNARNRHKVEDNRRRDISFEYTRSRYTINQVTELVRTLGWPAFIRQHLHFGSFTHSVRWHPQENILPTPARRAKEAHRLGREGQPLQSYLWTLMDAQRKESMMKRIAVDSPYGLYAATSTFLPVVSDRG